MRNTNHLTGIAAHNLVARMGEAAANFIASLAPDQRRKAVLDFSDQEKRTTWYYTPGLRDGLSLLEMERRQQQLAHQLVAAGLSRSGYVTAATIMGLETTLDMFEGWSYPGRGRDSTLYYLTVFGRPDSQAPWGWRFEGHHISLNYTIVGGQIVAPTPTFFGSNPAEAPLGGVSMLRPLAGIEDLARDLLHELTEAQRATAIITPAAPPDIVMSNRPQIVEGALPLPSRQMMGEEMTDADWEAIARRQQELGLTPDHLETLRYTAVPKGLAAAALTAAQQEILTALIGEYIHRMPDELAEIELAKLQAHGVEGIHFAWAGGLNRRQPHYYRLQGPCFLVEYDSTQNDANHIHSVWRDPEDDFGARLLAQHYAQAHA
jgi:hypothetical protein